MTAFPDLDRRLLTACSTVRDGPFLRPAAGRIGLYVVFKETKKWEAMTKITIVAGSVRNQSQSGRIARIVVEKIEQLDDVKVQLLDLAEIEIPLWNEELPARKGPWPALMDKLTPMVRDADGFVFVVPEWSGMVPPHVKNLFLVLGGGGDLAYKPGLIVSVGAGLGGAYPVSELRQSSYKNTRLIWLPDHMILRHCGQFEPGNDNIANPDLAVEKRLDYCLKVLKSFSDAIKPVRQEHTSWSDFPNGL